MIEATKILSSVVTKKANSSLNWVYELDSAYKVENIGLKLTINSIYSNAYIFIGSKLRKLMYDDHWLKYFLFTSVCYLSKNATNEGPK